MKQINGLGNQDVTSDTKPKSIDPKKEEHKVELK